eukprot:TRINITY_DN517_c0_g1_i1.p1 TRINITY_DN517_c0_g1~~TRINITY_DN517_c0_g1_i1.p1  ORF type:complete len:255 (-),score=68.08 TRINITY_DN517_c0_g1_i1:834-1598(-)
MDYHSLPFHTTPPMNMLSNPFAPKSNRICMPDGLSFADAYPLRVMNDGASASPGVLSLGDSASPATSFSSSLERITCEYCNKELSSKRNRRLHLNICKRNPHRHRVTFDCPLCPSWKGYSEQARTEHYKSKQHREQVSQSGEGDDAKQTPRKDGKGQDKNELVSSLNKSEMQESSLLLPPVDFVSSSKRMRISALIHDNPTSDQEADQSAPGSPSSAERFMAECSSPCDQTKTTKPVKDNFAAELLLALAGKQS